MNNNAVSQQIKKWDSLRKTLDPPRDVIYYPDPTPTFISMVNQVPHIREEEAAGQIQEYLTDEDLEKYPNTIQSGCIFEYAADSVDDLIRCYDGEFTKARLLQRFTTCHYTNPPDLRVTPQIKKEIEELHEEIGDDIWRLTDLGAGLDNVVYLMSSGILYNGNSHPPYSTKYVGYKMSQYHYIRSISCPFLRWDKSIFSFT